MRVSHPPPSVFFFHQFWKRTSGDKWHIFTGWMPFVSPDHCQSTKKPKDWATTREDHMLVSSCHDPSLDSKDCCSLHATSPLYWQYCYVLSDWLYWQYCYVLSDWLYWQYCYVLSDWLYWQYCYVLSDWLYWQYCYVLSDWLCTSKCMRENVFITARSELQKVLFLALWLFFGPSVAAYVS